MKAPIPHGHSQLNRDRAAFGVAVEGIGVGIGSGRQLLNGGAKTPLGEIEIGGDVRRRFGRAVTLEQARHAANAHMVGGELRLQIAAPLAWGAGVE